MRILHERPFLPMQERSVYFELAYRTELFCAPNAGSDPQVFSTPRTDEQGDCLLRATDVVRYLSSPKS